MQAFIQKYWQSPGAHQSPLIVIWIRAVCGFVVSFLSTFSNFSIFAAGFSFAFGNFAHYCVVLLIAPLIMSAMSYFSRESWFIVIAAVPFILSFKRRDNLTGVARVVCEPLWAKISYLILGGIQPLWPIFIVFIDLSDFRQTSPKHSRNNDKRKCVGKFWYLKYLSCGVHLRNTPRIFFSYSSFRYRYLDNQSEYWISASHVCWLMPCEWDYAAILLVLRHPIPDKLKKIQLKNLRSFHVLQAPDTSLHEKSLQFIFSP